MHASIRHGLMQRSRLSLTLVTAVTVDDPKAATEKSRSQSILRSRSRSHGHGHGDQADNGAGLRRRRDFTVAVTVTVTVTQSWSRSRSHGHGHGDHGGGAGLRRAGRPRDGGHAPRVPQVRRLQGPALRRQPLPGANIIELPAASVMMKRIVMRMKIGVVLA